jgi:hypothetical protein
LFWPAKVIPSPPITDLYDGPSHPATDTIRKRSLSFRICMVSGWRKIMTAGEGMMTFADQKKCLGPRYYIRYITVEFERIKQSNKNISYYVV